MRLDLGHSVSPSNGLTGAAEALICALNEGDAAVFLSLMATEDDDHGGFNDYDYTTDTYFKTDQVDEVRDRISLIHQRGDSFILDGVEIGSGANPDEDPPSVVGADVRRFGPGCPMTVFGLESSCVFTCWTPVVASSPGSRSPPPRFVQTGTCGTSQEFLGH